MRKGRACGDRCAPIFVKKSCYVTLNIIHIVGLHVVILLGEVIYLCRKVRNRERKNGKNNAFTIDSFACVCRIMQDLFSERRVTGRLTTTLAYIEKRRLQTIWHPRRCAMQFREAARRTKNEAFGFEMIRASFLLNQPAAHPCSRHMTPAPAAIGMSRNRTLAAALRFRSPRKALRGLSI